MVHHSMAEEEEEEEVFITSGDWRGKHNSLSRGAEGFMVCKSGLCVLYVLAASHLATARRGLAWRRRALM